MMWPLLDPTTRARSTNARSRSDSVCDRMIRAVDDQLVMPMTKMITTSDIRIPNTSVAAEPTTSWMIGVRIRARTNVGITRKKSVTRMRPESAKPPTNPATIPTTTPRKTVTNVASRPIDSEIRAPWTVRFSMSRPSSSVPKMWAADGASRREPVAVTAVCSGPTKSTGAIASTVKIVRITTPIRPSGRRTSWPIVERSPWARPPRGAAACRMTAVTCAPSGRGSRRRGRPPGWRARPTRTGAGTRPGAPGSRAPSGPRP